jgi:hypothetical protein
MSVKFGFPALSNKAVNTNTSRKKSGKKNKPLVIRVTDMILDENHPLIKNGKYGLNSLGLIIGVGTLPSNFSRLFTALPANPNLKKIPTINEHVEIFQSTIPNSNGIQWLYKEPLGLFGSSTPNGNQFPSTTYNINPPTQNISYTQASLGAVNVVSPTPPEIPVTSIVNPSQATYVAKSDINPLLPFEGDIIHEGRFGSSLRFGSTAKSKSQYANNWSTAGENGDPITILRNGQSPNSPKDGWIPVTEDVSNDLSSIYLTSYQQLNTFKVASELYQSYKTPPTFPSQYKNPQVILNSDRIVINAKTDSVLLSAQTSIGMSTNGSVNIDASSHYISSNDVRLGSKNASQPVLLGNDTIEVLKQLANAIKDLASILQVQRDYPNGALVTSYNSLAGSVLNQINSANGILAQLNDNSLKSKTTKVQ